MAAITALACTLSAAATVAAADAETATGDAGTSVVENWLTAFEGTAGTPLPEPEVVAVDGPGFDEALRIDVTAEPSNDHFDGEWSVAAGAPTETALAADDALVAGFWIRSVGESTGHRLATFMVEEVGGTYRKSGSALLELDGDWQYYEFGFRSRDDFAAGAARVKFWLGYGQQTVEIGGLTVVNHGQGTPADFPAVTYAGREPDAAWRDEAQQRIEEYRMGDLQVDVIDTEGNPVVGADVDVTMLEHAFNFGHAAGAELITGTGRDAESYRDVLLTDVNQVTLDNDLKWGFWDNLEHRTEHTLPAIQWLHEQDIDIHGHALVWPSWSRSPAYLQDLSPEELRSEIRSHVTEEASALADDVVSWDVVNEPYSEHDITDVLGRDEIAEWFALAEAADPDSVKLLNEYDMLSKNGWHQRKQDFVFELLQELLAQGAPVDALGMQAHFGALQPTAPEDLLPVIDRFASLGIGIQITEFDFITTDEQLQADYTRDFLTMVFSHPDVDAISSWGFWEGRYSWPSAAMYRLDWTQKPNGAAWQDLVLGQWWTDERTLTDRCGVASVDAFLGTYEVTVTTSDGQTSTHRVEHLSTDGTRVTIPLGATE